MNTMDISVLKSIQEEIAKMQAAMKVIGDKVVEFKRLMANHEPTASELVLLEALDEAMNIIISSTDVNTVLVGLVGK
jgi:division protein CdvB (Snf7/Vps24/ESCRT-III family)